jgi:membrane protein insertase Oxa1/YidC/SpoIIIJ
MHVSGWIWGNSRRVALNELLRIRSDSLSVRLFEWLRSCSVFPEPYAYVFVLLAISLGSTVLTLPWHIKCGRTAALVRSLLPEMERLKNLYGSDPVTYFKEVADLQRRHGIKTAPGCLIMIVQIAFTIWVLVAMRAYWPRMSLDCSRFLWVTDITQFDGWVVVLTGIVGVFLPVLMGQTRALGQPAVLIVFGGAVFSVIVWLIARHWQWPAYAFVFFLLQQVLGTTTQAVFAAVRRTAW